MALDRPLLHGLTDDEIRDAAERWLCLLKAEHLTWTARAGYEGDVYPVEHPDDRYLSLSMWTRSTSSNPLLTCSEKTHRESEELLTQFADKMRELLSLEKNEQT